MARRFPKFVIPDGEGEGSTDLSYGAAELELDQAWVWIQL